MMTDILIRDLPENLVRAMDAQASAMGLSRQEWLRAVVAEHSALPVVKGRYRLQGFSSLGLAVDIERTDDGVRHQEYGVTEESQPIVGRVVQLVKRNAPGDRELAIAELGSGFRVFELPA